MNEIYVQLLDEGTTTFRPTQGEKINGDIFRLLPTKDYDEELETWEFPPGSIVECRAEVKGGEKILIARRLVK